MSPCATTSASRSPPRPSEDRPSGCSIGRHRRNPARSPGAPARATTRSPPPSRSAGRSRTWCTTDLRTRLDKEVLPNNLPATEPHHQPISALRGRSDRAKKRMTHNDSLAESGFLSCKTKYPHNPTGTSCRELANGLPSRMGSPILPIESRKSSKRPVEGGVL